MRMIHTPARLLHDQLSAPAAAAGAGDDRRTRASPKSTSARCPECATTFPTCSTRAPSPTSPPPSRLRPAGPLDQRRHRRPERPLDADAPRRPRRHLEMLVALAAATGARALVLPCGALDHTPVDIARRRPRPGRRTNSRRRRHTAAGHGVELWTESLHFHRFCWNLERAQQLTDRLAGADGRDRDGLQPHRRLRRRPGRVRRALRPAASRTCTSATPCRATSTCPSATAASTSPRPQGPRGRRLSRATSRWNSKPATSPTTNGPPRAAKAGSY